VTWFCRQQAFMASSIFKHLHGNDVPGVRKILSMYETAVTIKNNQVRTALARDASVKKWVRKLWANFCKWAQYAAVLGEDQGGRAACSKWEAEIFEHRRNLHTGGLRMAGRSSTCPDVGCNPAWWTCSDGWWCKLRAHPECAPTTLTCLLKGVHKPSPAPTPLSKITFVSGWYNYFPWAGQISWITNPLSACVPDPLLRRDVHGLTNFGRLHLQLRA